MTESHEVPVRFARLPRRGLLLGLSTPRVACLAASLALLIPSVFLTGVAGALLTLPLWLTVGSAAVARWHRRPIIEWAPTVGHFVQRRLAGQTRFRARVDRPRPTGTLALPGDAAAMRFVIDTDTRRAMLHDPHAKTLTAVACVRHPAFVLLSTDEQARRVCGWSRALAHLATTGSGSRVQVLEISIPDGGHGINNWWAAHRASRANPWVTAQYDELVATVVPASATHRTLVALSIDTRSSHSSSRAHGRGLTAAAALLQQEMASLTASLRAADLRVESWLGEHELAATFRTAYQPGFETGDHPAQSLERAGPVSMDEQWDHLHHDNGYSTVLWISEWPRVDAPPSFLHTLIFQQGVRQTVSITYEPVPADEAMRDIRRARVEYATDAHQKAKLGMISDLADSVEARDVTDRERSLVAGHADIRFTGLITLTATTLADLEAAAAETARAATQCGCETRRLYGQQARAFTAAALPIARKVSP
ncbi:SCO6880 family protein [Flexivirga alba]|uniref:SCO6880 family protein n=1 Tax=Flexivirga alba TaxID=702742 RepID=A0ABW2AIR2_9MICO